MLEILADRHSVRYYITEYEPVCFINEENHEGTLPDLKRYRNLPGTALFLGICSLFCLRFSKNQMGFYG